MHSRLTARWAIEEGMPEADALVVADADARVDMLWPGSRKPARHFNPTASLVFAPQYLRRAIMMAGGGGTPSEALVNLGRALHCRQDSIGHGVFGLAHLRFRFGLLKRDPDDWNRMPARAREGIERSTRAMLRRYLAASAAGKRR